VALGFHNYHDTHKTFPYGGNDGPTMPNSADPLAFHNYAWTYHILPFMEQTNAYDEGTKNFNKLRQTVIEIYHCPSRRGPQLYKNDAKCDYAANGGLSGSANNGVVEISSRSPPSISDIIDGTANTLLVAERRVHRAYMLSGGCCGDNEDCYTYGWGDDNVRFAQKPPEPDTVDTMLPDTIVDGQFGGSHPGVVMAALADGSVRSVRFSVKLSVFRLFCRRNDRQSFSMDEL
jgi:hypothetical protein